MILIWQKEIMNNDFYIYHAKFQELSTKALDWYLKSLKFKPNNPEWQICRLKREIYAKKALVYLKKAKEICEN
jgi:hypothetical protein